MKAKIFKIGVLAIMLAVVFTAFSSFGVANAASTARVRVAHLSPDAPAVDVYADGTKVLSNVSFGTISDYLSVPAGDHEFKVFPAGAASTGTPAIDAKATLNAGTDYTIAATGKLANITATVLTDDNTAPKAGDVRVRVFHASPDAPAVDVAVKGGNVVVSNLAFQKASDYLEVPAGTYSFEVRPAGTTTVALPINNVNLQAGNTYTVIAEGLLSGTPALKAGLQVDSTAAAGGSSNTPTGAPSTGFAPTTADSNNINLPLLAAILVLALASFGLVGLRLSRNRK